MVMTHKSSVNVSAACRFQFRFMLQCSSFGPLSDLFLTQDSAEQNSG